MSDLLSAVTLAAALGSGLNAGVFFAFSSFVMPGLVRLPAPGGIAAMQAINRTAVRPAFMSAFLGTGVVCVALVVAALVDLGDDHAPWLLAGGALYLLGVVALTMGFHVPRNDALDGLDPDGSDAGARWARFLREWTAGNHVRAAAALAAAAAFTLALLRN